MDTSTRWPGRTCHHQSKRRYQPQIQVGGALIGSGSSGLGRVIIALFRRRDKTVAIASRNAVVGQWAGAA